MNPAPSQTRSLSTANRAATVRERPSRSLKIQKGISLGILTLLCSVLTASLQSAEPWKPLFNGKDFTGWTVPARGGASLNPADAGWKLENGIVIGGRAGPGQRGGTLASQAQFKDFELELDFMVAEQPAAPDGSCTNCTFNSGVYLRTGYQVNFGRREAGEFIGIVVHRKHPKAIRGNVLWLDTGDEKFPNLRKKEDWNHVQISFKGQRLQVNIERDENLRRHRQPGRMKADRTGFFPRRLSRVTRAIRGGGLLGDHEVELQFEVFELRLRGESPARGRFP